MCGHVFQMGNKGAFIRLPFSMVPEFVKFEAVVRPTVCVLLTAQCGIHACVSLRFPVCPQPHPPVKCMQYAGNMMSMFGL